MIADGMWSMSEITISRGMGRAEQRFLADGQAVE
jgi:hypothetical protein